MFFKNQGYVEAVWAIVIPTKSRTIQRKKRTKIKPNLSMSVTLTNQVSQARNLLTDHKISSGYIL